MSRSVHTQPRRIRAPRRVRAPHARRGTADPGRWYLHARALRDAGLAPCSQTIRHDDLRPAPLPRIIEQRPAPGRFHPAGRSHVRRLLSVLSESCTYGLRTVVLARNPAPDGKLLFGALRLPGTVILYDQPLSPWTLPGALTDDEAARLRAAGAEVQELPALHTLVTWPGQTLRDFMLYDVLLHEIGHHVLQHKTGKRAARITRTRDHEAATSLFARRHIAVTPHPGQRR